MTTQHKHHNYSKRLPFLFNPLEIAVCGYSNSGKTTLCSKLIEVLSEEYDLAYVKHGHRFDLDKPGKDSYKARESGARDCFVSSPDMHALMRYQDLNEYQPQKYLLDADIILAEGWKNAAIDKLLVLDNEKRKSKFHVVSEKEKR